MTTDQLDEWWDIYDANLNIIGSQQRRDALAPGEYHLTVAAIVFAADGRILLQQRSHEKLNHPDKWEISCGGSVLRGETSWAGIAREMTEELALQVPVSAAKMFMRTVNKDWIEDWYAVESNQSLEDLQLQASEVARTRLFTPDAAVAWLATAGIQPYRAQMLAAIAIHEQRR